VHDLKRLSFADLDFISRKQERFLLREVLAFRLGDDDVPGKLARGLISTRATFYDFGPLFFLSSSSRELQGSPPTPFKREFMPWEAVAKWDGNALPRSSIALNVELIATPRIPPSFPLLFVVE